MEKIINRKSNKHNNLIFSNNISLNNLIIYNINNKSNKHNNLICSNNSSLNNLIIRLIIILMIINKTHN